MSETSPTSRFLGYWAMFHSRICQQRRMLAFTYGSCNNNTSKSKACATCPNFLRISTTPREDFCSCKKYFFLTKYLMILLPTMSSMHECTGVLQITVNKKYYCKYYLKYFHFWRSYQICMLSLINNGGPFAFFTTYFNFDLTSLERALVSIGMDVKTKKDFGRRSGAYKNFARY